MCKSVCVVTVIADEHEKESQLVHGEVPPNGQHVAVVCVSLVHLPPKVHQAIDQAEAQDVHQVIRAAGCCLLCLVVLVSNALQAGLVL